MPSLHIVEHSIQLSRHKRYTHIGQVLQDLIQQLGLYVMPTLSGGTHHYSQLHEDPPSSYYQDFPTDPKLDYFRHDRVDGWLANHQTLPSTYLEIKTYINDATTTLMGADNVKYIWTLTASPTQAGRYYAINMWAKAVCDLGETLALFMGFLEFNPSWPGQTRIVAHNDVWVDTGNNTRARLVVRRLDRQHVGISNTDFQLGDVRLNLDVCADRLFYMLNKRVLLDMGAWRQEPPGEVSTLLPYALYTFPAFVVALEPN